MDRTIVSNKKQFQKSCFNGLFDMTQKEHLSVIRVISYGNSILGESVIALLNSDVRPRF